MRACFAPVALGLAVTEGPLGANVLRRHHAMGEGMHLRTVRIAEGRWCGDEYVAMLSSAYGGGAGVLGLRGSELRAEGLVA
jgi:hypothetical protein